MQHVLRATYCLVSACNGVAVGVLTVRWSWLEDEAGGGRLMVFSFSTVEVDLVADSCSLPSRTTFIFLSQLTAFLSLRQQ